MFNRRTLTGKSREAHSEKMRSVEQRFRTLVEFSPEGIRLLDLRGQVLYMNTAAAQLLNLSSSNTLSISLYDALSHTDKQAVAKAFERVATAPDLSAKAQYSITQADGTTRWLEETYVNRLNIPDLAAIVATLHDITEQKQAELERETRLQERGYVLAQTQQMQAEEARLQLQDFVQKLVTERDVLREREAQARTTAELTSDYAYAYHFRPNGAIEREWTTSAFMALTGFDPEEFDERGWEQFIHPDDKEQIEERLRAILAGLADVREWRIITRQGEILWLRDYCRPILDSETGEVVRVYGAVQDITQRKEAEQQKDDFIGMAGHELRTPLTSVKAYVQLARRGLQRLADPNFSEAEKITRIDDLLERIEHQVQIQTRLISDLLDVSRITANNLELHFDVCDLVKVVREVVTDQRAVNTERPFNLTLPEVDTLPVIADADRIGQVLNNYLTNAHKYSDDNKPIEVRLEIEHEFVRISVQDEGPGLTPYEQQHIWERFYQTPGKKIQHGQRPGLGLGLYICQTIISKHNGEVGVTSQRGTGSTFWFTLPIIQQGD